MLYLHILFEFETKSEYFCSARARTLVIDFCHTHEIYEKAVEDSEKDQYDYSVNHSEFGNSHITEIDFSRFLVNESFLLRLLLG